VGDSRYRGKLPIVISTSFFCDPKGEEEQRDERSQLLPKREFV
jgi:hypothetical protein